MNNFFKTSEDEEIRLNGRYEYETESRVIPDNTVVEAEIEGAVWEQYLGDRFIKLTWCVINGVHTNRKVFHKLKVYDADVNKADKAKKMLVAIDHNCGGKLLARGVEPTDMDMSLSLLNKPMTLKVGTWEYNGKVGNWVKSVSGIERTTKIPTSNYIPQAHQSLMEKATNSPNVASTAGYTPLDEQMDEEIPF